MKSKQGNKGTDKSKSKSADHRNALWESMRNTILFCDSKNLAQVDQKEIRLTNVETGECVGVLRGHEALIASICLSPWNSLQLISCDVSGCVKVWDFLEVRCLKSFNNTNIERINGFFALVHVAVKVKPFKKKRDEDNGNQDDSEGEEKAEKPKRINRRFPARAWKVVEYNLQLDKDDIELKEEDVILSRKNAVCNELIVGTGSQSHYMICLIGKNLFMYNHKTKTTDHYIHHVDIKVAVLHPCEDILIIGDAKGQIFIFRFHGKRMKDAVRTLWHWHAHSVHALAFSQDGSHFISGGEEAVVVQWQLETGSKEFLPRQGGPIRQLAYSPDGTRWGMSLFNNTVRVIDARTKDPVATIQGSGGASSLPSKQGVKTFSLGMVVEPLSSAVVVQRTPGLLQFFDLHTNHEIASVNVTMRNNVSQTEKDRPITPAYVERVAFSPVKGTFMVTVEQHGFRRSMKFWVLDRSPKDGNNTSSHGVYRMTTHVDQPHTKSVVGLFVHPNDSLVISASRDGLFRLWEIDSATGQWTCRSCGYFRKSPITAASLSFDGSLLALAYENIVTLWNPVSNSMLTSFMLCGTPRHAVRNLAFFKQNLLACSTVDGTVAVWDILKGQVAWSVRFGDVNAMRGTTSKLLVVGKNKTMFVFTGSPVPSEVFSVSLSKFERVSGVAVLPHSSKYVYSTEAGAVHIFRKKAPLESEKFETTDPAAQSTYALMSSSIVVGKRKLSHDENQGDSVQAQTKISSVSAAAIKSLSAYPSYVLPPLSKLVKSLLVSGEGVNASEPTSSSSEASQQSSQPKSKKQKKAGNATQSQQQQTSLETTRRQDKALETEMTDFFRKNLAKLVK